MCKPKGTNPNGHDRCSGHVREEMHKREDEVQMLLKDEMKRHRKTPAWLEKIDAAANDLQSTLLDYAGTPEGAAGAHHLSRMTNMDDIRQALGDKNPIVDKIHAFFPESLPEGHDPADPADPRNVIHRMGAIARRAVMVKYYHHSLKGALAVAGRAVTQAEEAFYQSGREGQKAGAQELLRAKQTHGDIADFLGKVEKELEQGAEIDRISQWGKEFLPSDTTAEARRLVDEHAREMEEMAREELQETNPKAREIFVLQTEIDRLAREGRNSTDPAIDARIEELHWRLQDVRWGPDRVSHDETLYSKSMFNTLHGLANLSDGRTAYIAAKHEQDNKKGLGSVLRGLVKR